MDSTALGRADALLDEMSPDEQLTLLEHVVRRLRGRTEPSRRPGDLRGLWAGKFPEDLDIDATLAQIRHGWLDSMDDLRP